MTLLGRRAFMTIAVGTAGAMLIGAGEATATGMAAPFGPFLRVFDDGAVEVVLPVIEMGQGIHSTLAAAVGEELDCSWSAVRVVAAPSGDAYRGPLGSQLTFGSRSTRTWLTPMRKAGATARDLIVRAAAGRWGVAPDACHTAEGVVIGPDRRALAYGALVAEAARLTPALIVPLKPANAWRLLGRALPRKDVPAKTDGTAIYGIDVRLPGMLYASPRFGPTHGARVAAFDAAAIAALPGVRTVVPLTRGVAVVADSTWRARQAAAALPIRFDVPEGLSSAQMSTRLCEAFAGDGIAFVTQGDADAVLAAADRSVTAEYETPFLVHAALEPINCTALVKDGACEVWVPTQAQSRALAAAAHAAGVSRDRVTIHSTLIGGGFGRRSMVDYVEQAVTVARAVAGTPVKLTWSREDDSVHDYFRPASVGRFRAALDRSGKIGALACRLAAPAIRDTLVRELAAYDPYKLLKGVDVLAPGGINDQPYVVSALRAEHIAVDLGVETGSWRSIAHSQNCFMLESFMDELAAAAGQDPLRFRLDHLAPASRGRGVLEAVARAVRWPRRAGRTIGLSLVTYSNSFAATAIEVQRAGARYAVAGIWCAVDCGPVMNPDTAHAQAVGGALFGLSAALTGEATFDAAGRLEQTRLSHHRLLGIADVPPVHVVFQPSGEDIGGMGEPTVPGIAPALANALFAATGTRVRRLPISRSGLV